MNPYSLELYEPLYRFSFHFVSVLCSMSLAIVDAMVPI